MSDKMFYGIPCIIAIVLAPFIMMLANSNGSPKGEKGYVSKVKRMDPLSGAMDGRAWNKASMESRMSLTDDISRRLRNSGTADVPSEFLLSALNEFYNSTEPAVLDTRIADIVGLTVAASEKDK